MQNDVTHGYGLGLSNVDLFNKQDKKCCESAVCLYFYAIPFDRVRFIVTFVPL